MKSKTASSVPFVSLGYGDSLNVLDGVAPTLQVAGIPSEAAQFTKLLHDQKFNQKNTGNRFQTRTGYRCHTRNDGERAATVFRYQRIEGTSKVVKFIVKLRDPAPRQFTQSALTEPFHVIRVPRSSLVGTPGIALAVYTAEGKVLAQTKR